MAIFGGLQRVSAVVRLLPEKALIRIFADGNTTEIPVDAAMLNRGEIATAVGNSLSGVQKFPEPLSAVFVLPHNLYGVDYISLPTMKKARLDDSFKTELRAMYKNYDALSFQSMDIFSGKSSVTYRVIFARRDLLDSLKSCFSAINVQIGRFLPYGAAVLEGASKLNPAVRKTACLVLDIGEKYSYISACGRETLLGGMEIPFGAEALSDARVMPERVLYQHDSAELLVINARERAKSTKLTMAINLEDEYIDDSVLNDEDEIAPDPVPSDITHVGEEHTSDADLQYDDDADDAEPMEENAGIAAVKTLRKSAVRQLPKFMRREEPTTRDGYILENFRLFERRVLLTAREMSLNDYFPRVETVYLSMPDRFAFVADEMNRDNPALKWSYLQKNGEGSDDLPTFGALNLSSGKMPVL